jgi:sulfatase modifying factor 1
VALGELAGLGAIGLILLGCSTERAQEHEHGSVTTSASPVVSVPVPPPAVVLPRVLYLPDAGPRVLPEPAVQGPAMPPREILPGHCPPEMVWIRREFCIDRYEASLVDASNGKTLSPYYHPRPHAVRREYERALERRAHATTELGRTTPVEPPPDWQLEAGGLEPLAVSAPGVTPNGYLSGEVASAACARAGKRLCTATEWVTACRGEKNRKFPYGEVYDETACNVGRVTHPARLLHGNASIGHLDPRLNQMAEEGGQPLLRRTGATLSCASEWGGDAVYDMVGNLDEWIEDPEGTFLGGFYARKTREGCDSRIEVHGFDYYDYSLGVRCCKSP